MSKKIMKQIQKKKGVKKGIKVGVVALFAVLAISTVVMAADTVDIPNLNLGGDTLYLTDTGTLAVGIGSDIASFYDLVTIRAEYVAPVEENDYHRVGLGVGANIPKLVETLGGQWIQKNINSTVGVMGLTNLDGKVNPELGLYVTILNVEF